MRFLKKFNGESREQFLAALDTKEYEEVVAIYRTNESTAVSYANHR